MVRSLASLLTGVSEDMTAQAIKAEEVFADGVAVEGVESGSAPLAQPGSAQGQASSSEVTSQQLQLVQSHTNAVTCTSGGTKRPRPELQHLSSLTDEGHSDHEAQDDHPQDGPLTGQPSLFPPNPHHHPHATRTSNRVSTRTRRFSTSSHGAHSDSSSESYHTSRSHNLSADTSGTKRRWTPDEDARLVELLQQVPALPWPAISEALPGRSEGSCVSRWQNHLSRVVRQTEREAGHKVSSIASAYSHGKLGTTSRRRWSEEEDDELVGWAMHIPALSWDEVAERMEGRSTASCMGRWYNHLAEKHGQRPDGDEDGPAVKRVKSDSRKRDSFRKLEQEQHRAKSLEATSASALLDDTFDLSPPPSPALPSLPALPHSGPTSAPFTTAPLSHSRHLDRVHPTHPTHLPSLARVQPFPPYYGPSPGLVLPPIRTAGASWYPTPPPTMTSFPTSVREGPVGTHGAGARGIWKGGGEEGEGGNGAGGGYFERRRSEGELSGVGGE